MNLFARQEQRCRCREGTCGHSRGRGGWDELGDQDWRRYATMCKRDITCSIAWGAQLGAL